MSNDILSDILAETNLDLTDATLDDEFDIEISGDDSDSLNIELDDDSNGDFGIDIELDEEDEEEAEYSFTSLFGSMPDIVSLIASSESNINYAMSMIRGESEREIPSIQSMPALPVTLTRNLTKRACSEIRTRTYNWLVRLDEPPSKERIEEACDDICVKIHQEVGDGAILLPEIFNSVALVITDWSAVLFRKTVSSLPTLSEDDEKIILDTAAIVKFYRETLLSLNDFLAGKGSPKNVAPFERTQESVATLNKIMHLHDIYDCILDNDSLASTVFEDRVRVIREFIRCESVRSLLNVSTDEAYQLSDGELLRRIIVVECENGSIDTEDNLEDRSLSVAFLELLLLLLPCDTSYNLYDKLIGEISELFDTGTSNFRCSSYTQVDKTSDGYDLTYLTFGSEVKVNNIPSESLLVRGCGINSQTLIIPVTLPIEENNWLLLPDPAILSRCQTNFTVSFGREDEIGLHYIIEPTFDFVSSVVSSRDLSSKTDTSSTPDSNLRKYRADLFNYHTSFYKDIVDFPELKNISMLDRFSFSVLVFPSIEEYQVFDISDSEDTTPIESATLQYTNTSLRLIIYREDSEIPEDYVEETQVEEVLKMSSKPLTVSDSYQNIVRHLNKDKDVYISYEEDDSYMTYRSAPEIAKLLCGAVGVDYDYEYSIVTSVLAGPLLPYLADLVELDALICRIILEDNLKSCKESHTQQHVFAISRLCEIVFKGSLTMDWEHDDFEVIHKRVSNALTAKNMSCDIDHSVSQLAALLRDNPAIVLCASSLGNMKLSEPDWDRYKLLHSVPGVHHELVVLESLMIILRCIIDSKENCKVLTGINKKIREIIASSVNYDNLSTLQELVLDLVKTLSIKPKAMQNHRTMRLTSSYLSSEKPKGNIFLVKAILDRNVEEMLKCCPKDSDFFLRVTAKYNISSEDLKSKDFTLSHEIRSEVLERHSNALTKMMCDSLYSDLTESGLSDVLVIFDLLLDCGPIIFNISPYENYIEPVESEEDQLPLLREVGSYLVTYGYLTGDLCSTQYIHQEVSLYTGEMLEEVQTSFDKTGLAGVKVEDYFRIEVGDG